MKKWVLILTIAFIVFACDNGDMDNGANQPNPFIGTWENESNGYRIAFTPVIATGYYPNGDIYWVGTYTYNATEIKILIDTTISAQEIIWAAYDGIIVVEYRFEDDKLIYNGNPCVKIN
ncbi:MAG: hypothetical protein FWD36_03395 [Treponema sp.]|nr:hypothetical protein [Treponema sp.]